jgi:hypothetical protein
VKIIWQILFVPSPPIACAQYGRLFDKHSGQLDARRVPSSNQLTINRDLLASAKA